MQNAVEAYLAMNLTDTVVEADIVKAGFLREESVLHDVQPDGTIIPAPGGICTS